MNADLHPEAEQLESLRRRTSAKWRAYDADVLPMWVAEMDFALAPPIAEALHAAIDRSDVGYRWAADLPAALAGFAHRRLGWEVDPDRVIVMGDVLVAIAESLRYLTSPGDEVVITPPVYPPFFVVTRDIVGRSLVEVPLLPDDTLDLVGLQSAFARPEVTAFLLSNPHNPTGTIHSEAVLRGIAALAREHGVTVISDEIWTPVVLGGAAAVPYLTLGEELTGPDVALVAASKAFNLAGLKCAQIVTGSAATAELLRERMPMEVTYAAGQLGVIAAVAAYRDGDAWLDATLATITANAAELSRLLARDLPQVGYRMPSATYLAWLDCSAISTSDPAAVFLERGRVALNAGAPFGAPGFARLNLATTPEILAEGVRRMAGAVSEQSP